MATPKRLHRKGHDIAFIEDGSQGNPAFAVRDRTMGFGHKAETATTSNVKWGVVNEPLMFSHNVAGGDLASVSESVYHTFKRRRPERRKFEVTVPINGTVDSSEGVVAFNCPTDRSFQIVKVSESHTVREATAAQCNLQVAINPDAATINASDARKLVRPNELDVETEGIAVNQARFARLDGSRPPIIAGSMALDSVFSEDRSGTLFTVPVGRSYRVLSLSSVTDVPDDDSGTSTLTFKKCTTTDDPASAGTSLHASGTSDMKGADDTVLEVALTATNATKELAAGNRLCFFFNAGNADGTVFVRPTMSWVLQETTAGVDSDVDKIIRPGERVMVYFEQDDGLTVQDTTEYIGCVTLTLQEVEAEEHQEQVLSIHLSDADNLAATGLTVFTATEHRWRVESVEESHSVVDDGTAPKLICEKSTDGDAVGSGTDIIGTTDIALDAAAINTQVAGTLVSAAAATLEIGERIVLSMDDSGASALGTYDGVITIVVRPDLSSPTTVRVVSYPIEKAVLITGANLFVADQDYRLVGVSFTPVVIETSVTAPSIMLEKLSAAEVVAGGTIMLTAQAGDADATVDTIQHLTPIAADAIITNGQTVSFYMTDDGNSDAAVASTELRGGITLFLEPINDARGPIESAFIYTNDTGGIMTVTDVSAIWERSETQATTLNVMLERVQSAEIISGGNRIIGDTNIDLVNTVKNTRTTGTVVTSGFEDLASTDRLAVFFVNDAGTRVNPGDLEGLEVSVRMTAQAASGSPATEGVLFTNQLGRPIEFTGIAAAWDVPESTSATLNLLVERLTVGEAAGNANGDRLLGLTDINVKGADDTAGSGTVVTTESIRASVLSTGSGLDDATAGGTYVRPSDRVAGRTVLTFEVLTTGAVDTVQVKQDGRILNRSLNMATAAISVSDGITMLWTATTGHTLGDIWTVIASRNSVLEQGDRLGYYFDVDAGGTVTVPTELAGLNVITEFVPTTLADAAN